MDFMNNWLFWVIVYLVSAVVFAQTFKKANRKMKDAGSLTILLEIFTAIFSILYESTNEIETIKRVIVIHDIDAIDNDVFLNTLLKASLMLLPNILNSFIIIFSFLIILF